jgi:hypothetical protein
LSVEKAGQVRGNGPEQRQSRGKAPGVCRLRRLKAENQADELVPAWQLRRPDLAKVLRPRRLNAAEAAADQASARQNQVEQLDQPERREQHRRQLSRVHGRNSKSVVASQRDGPVRNQVPARVEQGKFRHRDAIKVLSVNDSARRRLRAPVNLISVAEVRRLDFGNRSRPRQVAVLQVKHGAKEKECRALMVSRPRHNSNSTSSSSNEAARLRQPITDRGRASRKVGRRNNQKKRHRHAHNNFGAITPVAPDWEQTNHNRIGVFLCDGLGFRPHLLLNVFRPAYSLGDVTWPNGV